MMARRIGHYAAYLALRVGICVLQALPAAACERIARWLAWLAGDVLQLRRDVVDDNLRHAFAEQTEQQRRQLARRMWEHLFLLVAEVALAGRKIHHTNWRRYLRFKRAAVLAERLLDDRPLLLVSAHFGNFELAGFGLGILGFPTYAVARTLDNPLVNDFVNRFRGTTGQHIVPKKGGYEQILAVLARGGVISFLADQYAGTKGCWVEFFGRPASAHKAIALLSLEHEAPMVVGYARRTGALLHLEFGVQRTIDPRDGGAAVDGVRELTQWYTDALEEMVRAAPEQYWWIHRRWKDTRPLRRKGRYAGGADRPPGQPPPADG